MENTNPLVIAGIPIIIDERVRTYCGCDVILFNPELFVEVADNSTLLVLKGKVLGCWCKPGPCHGDVLARIANE